MAFSVDLTAYSEYILIESTDLAGAEAEGLTIYRSFVNDSDYADAIITATEDISFEDRSVVQRWTYYYWYDVGAGKVAIGSAQLTQPVLAGQRGPRRRFSGKVTVECPLCGFECKKSELRRGYVKPHITGENYLSNAAAPENWTYGGFGPSYFDANVYLASLSDYNPIIFPQWEKEFGYWQPGCPLSVNARIPTIGQLSSALSTSYAIVWVYAYTSNMTFTIDVYEVAAKKGTATLPNCSRGWHKAIVTCSSMGAGTDIKASVTTGATDYWAFGGMQIVTRDPEIAQLPHRSTGAGDYTTGGMMPLCPECYSGLRRRVPWE